MKGTRPDTFPSIQLHIAYTLNREWKLKKMSVDHFQLTSVMLSEKYSEHFKGHRTDSNSVKTASSAV